MLFGRALQYYFDELQGKRLTFEQLCSGIRKRFLTEELTRALLRKWESITLQSIMTKNIEKNTTKCLEILVAHLHDIQSRLSKKFESCQSAYIKPAGDLTGIIANLHSSLAAAPAKTQFRPQAFYIDRRFKGTRRGPRSKTCHVC